MNYQTLRILMRLKREVLHLAQYKPNNVASLRRKEKIPFTRYQSLGCYSKELTQKIYDPRSQITVGHHFNPRQTYLLNNVILEPRQGLVYTENGQLLSESTNWSTSNLYESFPWNPRKIKRKINHQVTLNLTSNAFGHWLVEDLGSTLYLMNQFPEALVLIDKNRPRFVSELLAFLGREYIELQGPAQVENLLFVSKENDSGWMHPEDLSQLTKFGSTIQAHADGGPEKIYATRRSLKRSPSNEADLERLFADHGFTVMKLEELNFLSEISLMKNVKELAGVSGSWQFNSIWMDKGIKMLDIVNENYWTELAHRVCSMKDLDYRFLVYEGEFNNSVDTQALLKLLNYS